MTTIMSFNINGVRARPHQLQAIKDGLDPDVIGLQETKVHDEQFPLADIEALGYHVEYFGQKSHYGVALLSKTAPVFVQKGWPWADDEAPLDTPARRWGVDTPYPGVLLAGAGSRRGGGVSGLGGYHAARAVLED